MKPALTSTPIPATTLSTASITAPGAARIGTSVPRGIVLAATFLAVSALFIPSAVGQENQEPEHEKETPKEASTPTSEEIEAAVEAYAEAKTATDSARAWRDLVRLGPAALEATLAARAALEESEDEAGARRLGRAVDHLLGQKLAQTIRERQATGLVFDGQYDDMKEQPGALRALFRLVDDETTDLGLRFGAINAIADVAEPSALTRVRELESDPLLPPPLREELGILMAILGDTRKVEHRIRKNLQNSESGEIPSVVQANLELSQLYYKIRKYSKAIECYERVLGIFRRVREQTPRNRGLDRQFALHLYNAACSYSLNDQPEKARERLLEAIQLDPMHYNNIDLDGDLKKMREAEGYERFKKKARAILQAEEI